MLGEERDEYLRRAHEHLNIYTGLENYRASWRRLGFGDDDFVRGGSERLCDALVVHGDAAAIGAASTSTSPPARTTSASRCSAPRSPTSPAQWAELGGALTDRDRLAASR